MAVAFLDTAVTVAEKKLGGWCHEKRRRRGTTEEKCGSTRQCEQEFV